MLKDGLVLSLQAVNLKMSTEFSVQNWGIVKHEMRVKLQTLLPPTYVIGGPYTERRGWATLKSDRGLRQELDHKKPSQLGPWVRDNSFEIFKQKNKMIYSISCIHIYSVKIIEYTNPVKC